MCGIIGSIGLRIEGSFGAESLKHRGPDGFGVWESPIEEFPVVLVHTRLAILDLSANGSQPMYASNNRYVFVFNGEIYNFIELRSQLCSRGHNFLTETDTEVFFKGLLEYGPSFQNQCNGMWSFCLWDRKTNKALFGRDRFGKKPLFYTWVRTGQLIFASEMKAIYPYLATVQPSKNISKHFQYLFDYESSEECAVEGIKRLPPGHYGELENGHLKTYRWWNTLDHIEIPPSSYEEQVEKWREIFLDSVKIRMRSDVRVGTALSGGLDSSATLSAMSYLANNSGYDGRETKDWQNGFCAHFPGSSQDEIKWAEMVANLVGIPLQTVKINPINSEFSISEALYQVEDPYLTLPTPMLATYRAIANAGIKVTLDGHGADELFSGYGHLNAIFKVANPMQVAELVAIMRSLDSGNYCPDFSNVYWKFIKVRLVDYMKTNLRGPGKVLKTLFGARELEFLSYKLSYADQDHEIYKNFDSFTKDLYEIFHITILPTLLRNYDRYSMASGVEIRMPFMDHRLVTYTFSLPWTSKVGGGYTKRIMRDALKGILPEPIRTRRDKIGWNAPLHEWLKSGPLKNQLEILFSTKIYPRDLITEWEYFQKKVNPSVDDGQKIWAKLMPYLWRESLSSSGRSI